MTKDEREHMNKLSKEVFGSAYKWQKIMRDGERVNIMSKRRADKNNGEEVEVGYYAHPTIDELRAGLEKKAKEMVDQKKLQENKNVKSIELPGESTSPASGGTEGDRSSGSSTGSGNKS